MGDSFKLIQKTFGESNFRDIVDRVIIVIDKDVIVNVFGDNEDTEGINGLIGYCYIDYSEGLSFQPCAAVSAGDDYLRLADLPNQEIIYIFRFRDETIANSYIEAGHVMQLYNIPEDAILMHPEDLEMDMSMFDKFVDIFSIYEPSDEVAEIRMQTDLDQFRNNLYPDDVAVWLYRPGKNIEQVWVRTMFCVEKAIVGKLLNEPYGDLDYHEGEIIEFQMIQPDDSNEERILVATGRKVEMK